MLAELAKLGLVMLGGGVGAGARYVVGLLFASVGSSSFPWATFSINVLGSVILGYLVAWAQGQPERPGLLLLVGTGFCGGFTTFSTFSVETLRLIEQKQFTLALVYAFGSVVAAVGGACLGSRA